MPCQLGRVQAILAWLVTAAGLSFCYLPSLAYGSTELGEKPELYLATGRAYSPAATHLHSSLAEMWPRLAHLPNFDRAGFNQIYLGVLGKIPRFPYFAGLNRSDNLRFLNFGKYGFFLGIAQKNSSNTPQVAAIDPDEAMFEDLEWGVLYLSPSVVKNPGFLRDHYLTSHGASQIRKSLDEIIEAGTKTADLRSAYLLVWSGGANCLASQDRAADKPHNPPQWMRCDPRLGEKIGRLNDLSDDEQFMFLISGRQANLENWSCRALGVLEPIGIQGFGLTSGPKGRCILYRTSAGDQEGVRSKVHCLDPVEGRHLWRNFDHVDFAFPTSDAEKFFLVESRFFPPRLTEIDLQKGYSRTRSKGQSPIAGVKAVAGPGQIQGLPQGNYGVYQCQASVFGEMERRLYFVDQEVFQGRRQVNPEEDWIYTYLPSRATGLVSRAALWSEVMREFPAIDSFPEMSCAYELDIDVKCGVRVLQTALQMLWESRTGALELVGSPAVIRSTFAIQLQLLQKVESELPDWGLAKETAFLLAQYERLLHDKSRSDGLVPMRRSLSSENSWRRYISAPDGIWE